MHKKFEKNIDEKYFDKAVELLKELIKIPSVSCNEKAIARYIADYLENIGAEVIIQPVGENSENVLATIKGNLPGKDILLIGHLDTVPPMEGWDTDPFWPVEKSDKIYGLGSCDMKSGLAIAMTIAEMIALNRENLKGNIKILFMADEEGFSTGIKKAIKEMDIKAEIAYMFEPHYERAMIGATGKMLIKVGVKGKASHAAHPELGINAIEEASKFIANLDSIDSLTHDKMSYQPFVTFNINGGYEKYSVTVPDYCEVVINKHTVPGETTELVLNRLKELKTRLNLKSDFEFEIKEPFYPPFTIDENSKYLHELKKVYNRTVKKELGIEYSTGVSDANCLVGSANITTITFGASGGPIHAPNEWVSKKQIYDVLKVYANLLCNYIY